MMERRSVSGRFGDNRCPRDLLRLWAYLKQAMIGQTLSRTIYFSGFHVQRASEAPDDIFQRPLEPSREYVASFAPTRSTRLIEHGRMTQSHLGCTIFWVEREYV